MNEGIIRVDLEQAAQHLAIAQEEIARPHKDVVRHMVCDHARQAIRHYVDAFLLSNNVAVDVERPLHDMINQILKMDERFMQLKTSSLIPANHEEEEWMNEASAEEMLELAEQVQQIMMAAATS